MKNARAIALTYPVIKNKPSNEHLNEVHQNLDINPDIFSYDISEVCWY